MKEKKVTRYSCEFCRRVAYKRPTMAAHESGCTNNPNRICKLCERIGEEQTALEILLENAGQVDELRKVANGCPACMLTGVRAYNKDAEEDQFAWIDYKAEHERYWGDVNEDERRELAAAVGYGNR